MKTSEHVIPRSEFVRRTGKIRDFMSERGLGALLVFSQPRIHIWAQTGHVPYLSNWSSTDRLADSIVVLPIDGEPSLLMSGLPYQADQAREVSWIKDIRLVSSGDIRAAAVGYQDSIVTGYTVGSLRDFGAETRSILKDHGLDKSKVGIVGVESMPFPIYNSLNKALRETTLEIVEDIVAELRSVKSKSEIGLMNDSARLSDLGFETLLETAEEGMWGYEAVSKMEQAVRSKGADFARFWMTSGPSEGWKAFSPSFAPHERQLKKGDQVAVCSYIIYKGYWAHAMRSGTLGGTSKQHREIFGDCREIANAMIDAMKPGVTISEIVRTGKHISGRVRREIYGGRFGHGIGLDYGEKPSLFESNTNDLRAGEVVEIHPLLAVEETGGFYTPLGDVCLVTDKGTETLTKFPREPFRI